LRWRVSSVCHFRSTLDRALLAHLYKRQGRLQVIMGPTHVMTVHERKVRIPGELLSTLTLRESTGTPSVITVPAFAWFLR